MSSPPTVPIDIRGGRGTLSLEARGLETSASEIFRLAQHSGHAGRRNCFSRASAEKIFRAIGWEIFPNPSEKFGTG